MVQYTRETLYEEAWNEPVSTVAKKYGVSDVAIHKITQKNTLNEHVFTRTYSSIISCSIPCSTSGTGGFTHRTSARPNNMLL